MSHIRILICRVDDPASNHMTEHGSRYLSGVDIAFLQRLQLAVLLGLGPLSSLLVLADGARWIRSFFTDTLT